ncbi:hypothetical protein SAMN05444166_4160 [Singulisphaera sp. GP187]|uniref:hypothetical protein n=1 Tax=Singulisphaera sp. GP187 TaxID=1882752 RepID=UPI0009260F24|nr:hypothetical protein [Singulisphaera sp. GP187]SIO37033.1 hypothetical protein SAMN05444166_4160 [Singulisphaera sp. GP187]
MFMWLMGESKRVLRSRIADLEDEVDQMATVVQRSDNENAILHRSHKTIAREAEHWHNTAARRLRLNRILNRQLAEMSKKASVLARERDSLIRFNVDGSARHCAKVVELNNDILHLKATIDERDETIRNSQESDHVAEQMIAGLREDIEMLGVANIRQSEYEEENRLRIAAEAQITALSKALQDVLALRYMAKLPLDTAIYKLWLASEGTPSMYPAIVVPTASLPTLDDIAELREKLKEAEADVKEEIAVMNNIDGTVYDALKELGLRTLEGDGFAFRVDELIAGAKRFKAGSEAFPECRCPSCGRNHGLAESNAEPGRYMCLHCAADFDYDGPPSTNKDPQQDHEAMNLVRQGNGDVSLSFVVVGGGLDNPPTHGFECNLYQGKAICFDSDPAKAIIDAHKMKDSHEAFNEQT